MIFNRSNSVAERLSLVFKLTNGFALLLATIGFTLILAYFSLRSFRQELVAVAQVVALSSRAPLTFSDSVAAHRVLNLLETNKNIVYSAIIDRDRSVFASYGTAPFSSSIIEPDLIQSKSWTIKRGFVVVTEPILLEGDRIGTLLVTATTAYIILQFGLIAALVIAVSILIAIAAILFSMKLKGWVSEPIHSLSSIANKVSNTRDFSVRLDPKGVDDISELMRSFNFMLESLETSDRGLRQAKDRAEKADRVKSAFLASMSHELRTPLHAIINITDEVLETKLDKEQTELLSIVKNAGSSLLSIINDILDFSKIEAGKMTLHSSAFAIDDFILQAVRMFQVLCANKGVTLSYSIESSLPKEIKADPGRLSQVLVNLIGNALKFTNTGGRIDINVRPASSYNEKLLMFTVSDTGIGIPEDQLTSIFEAFTQIQDIKTSRQGTGLGLSISARLVSLMGGRIWATSRVGQGSHFNFIIEYQEVALEVPELENPSNDGTTASVIGASHSDIQKNQDILILQVEDNPVNAKLAERLITKAGFRITTVGNGKEAVEIFQKMKFNLILMDINMPIMDGLEATRQIRRLEKENALESTPIIAVTASISPDETIHCFEVGMDELILKPFRAKEFLATITQVLESYSNKIPNRLMQ